MSNHPEFTFFCAYCSEYWKSNGHWWIAKYGGSTEPYGLCWECRGFGFEGEESAYWPDEEEMPMFPTFFGPRAPAAGFSKRGTDGYFE